MVGNRRSHGLNSVVDFVQTCVDDGPTQRLKALHVECDVVVHNKDGARPMGAGIADICEDSIKRVSVKIASAHFND